jgi:drug/metabolite transporter (DMT)-like permease
MNTKTYDWFILIVLALIWGSSFILMKRILLYFSPVQMATLRIGISGLVLLPLFIKNIKGKKITEIKWFFISGLLGNGIPALCFAYTQTKLNSSVTACLNALTPFFVLIVGLFLFKMPLKRNNLLGLVLGLSGALCLSLLRSNGSTETNYLYAGFAVLATLCYGINVNLLKLKFKNYDALAITSLSVGLVGLPCLVVLLLCTDVPTLVLHHPEKWQGVGYAALLGCFGTAFALILFNGLIQRTTAVFASSVTYLIPVVAMCIGWLDAEPLGWAQVLGMVAVLMGIYINSKA